MASFERSGFGSDSMIVNLLSLLSSRNHRISFLLTTTLFVSVVVLNDASSLLGQEVMLPLKNGMTIGPGLIGQASQVDQNTPSSIQIDAAAAKPIIVMDDGLRFTFVNQNKVLNAAPRPIALQKITTGNASEKAIGNHARIAAVSAALTVSDFDIFGRRLYSLLTPKGREDVLQGITEISPLYVRVEGMSAISSYIWDMRIGLNAVPPARLREILLNNIDRSQPQAWLDVVTLYQQAQRYREAREVLTLAIQQHPELDNQKSQIKQLDQLNAQLMLDETKQRLAAGQPLLAEAILNSFEKERLATETQLTIERRLGEILTAKNDVESSIDWIKKDVAALPTQELRDQVAPIVDEIYKKLNSNSRPRLADYLRLRDDKSLTPDQCVAMAIGGWLMGSGEAEKNLSVAVSAWEARSLVQEYLASPNQGERESIRDRLANMEAGVPRYVSRLIAQLSPPLPFPEPDPSVPPLPKGRHYVEVDNVNPPDVIPTKYWIQLPPEYDPKRQYPCVVSLHGQFVGAKKQLDWWVGDYNETFGMCLGEASRHGFIVITPEWAKPKQPYYGYTESEHARILRCLRHAMRRSSIDVDRVFISGHHMGGDAAWDLALAHPDLWAGMIAIGGDCDKYPTQYTANARYIPLYFVFGELDGAPPPMRRNGARLDDFLKSARYDCLLTVYQGRGRDHFQEELPRIMEWMNLSSHRRGPPPTEFEIGSSRASDRFYWWLESDPLTSEKIVNPILFKPGKTTIEAKKMGAADNGYLISNLAAKGATIWMSPSEVDFGKRISIYFKGEKKTFDVQPSLETLLEDVRTRADRKHPYWAKAHVDGK